MAAEGNVSHAGLILVYGAIGALIGFAIQYFRNKAKSSSSGSLSDFFNSSNLNGALIGGIIGVVGGAILYGQKAHSTTRGKGPGAPCESPLGCKSGDCRKGLCV